MVNCRVAEAISVFGHGGVPAQWSGSPGSFGSWRAGFDGQPTGRGSAARRWKAVASSLPASSGVGMADYPGPHVYVVLFPAPLLS
jgi:hypothetical protein